jgi:hypothetical protein
MDKPRPPSGLPHAHRPWALEKAWYVRPMGYPVENALFQWEEGYRRLQGARSDEAAYRSLGRAVMAIEEQLRRRLGSSFSVSELADLYASGDWELSVATYSDPDEEAAVLDPAAAVDAAFYLYMREASDFAGGAPRPRSG